jgi:histidine triad (HIT) family protein
MQDCVFCKIIANELPSEIVTQNNEIIVIKDIAPKASIHYLILPKKHIPDIQSFEEEDFKIASNMFKMIQQLANNLDDPKDFRILINNGSQAGQLIFHLHVHFLAGKSIPRF